MPQETGAHGIERGSNEFGRVIGFSDAIFAIAMTLLLEIEVSGLPPGDGDTGDTLGALRDALPKIISFGVSFYVIGRYWLARHWSFSRLEYIDRRFSPRTSPTWASSRFCRSRPR